MRSSSPEATEAAAADLAARLAPGDLVLVRGEMGAGKTTFVRGACHALGVAGPVTSPTFTIGNLYEAGGRRIAHLDLHRPATLEGEDPALLDDYVDPPTSAVLEWAAGAGGGLGRRGRVR